MLDAVVLNTVNQIKAMVASLSVGGSNPVTDTKVAELRTGLTDTRMANLDNIDTSTMAQIDLIKADLDTVLYHIVTSDSGLNTIKYLFLLFVYLLTTTLS